SPGIAADFHVWGSLAHVRAPDAKKLSPRTHACIFLGFPLDASGWVFYDPPPPVAPIAPPPPSCPAPSSVSHVTPQSSPPQRPVTIVSGGVGGAVAEVEGTGAAGACGVGSGGEGGVGVEFTPVEDMAALTQRPRPTSPPGFSSVPQFPPRTSLRSVAAEPGGIPAGGTGGTGGVGTGAAGSGDTGAGGTGTMAPSPRTVHFLTREQRLIRLETEEWEQFESARQQQQQKEEQSYRSRREKRRGHDCIAGAVTPAAGESGGGVTTTTPSAVAVIKGEDRAGVPPAPAGAVPPAAGESRGGVMAAAGEGSAGVPVPSQQTPEEAEQQRQRDLPDPARARLVCDPLPSPPVRPVQSLSSSPWTPHSPLGRAVSRYHADGPFHLVLRSRVPPPPVLPHPSESSLTVLHEPLSDYLRASRPIVSRVLSALVTHPSAPLLSVLALVTTVAGFASSHRLDYAAHLVSGTARSTSSGGAPFFPLEFLEDKPFEIGFLAAGVPHLCAMLLALEGDPDALDIPIPRTHAEAVSRPWASFIDVDAVPSSGTNVVRGMWLYKVKWPHGSPLVFKACYVARGFSQQEGVDFIHTFAPTPKMTTIQVLLHIAAQRDYELHCLDFSRAFLQGSLHKQIWLHRPSGFTGSFPPRI
ncbi:unnamed protein product, partial [Closterium sp. NIES-53]